MMKSMYPGNAEVSAGIVSVAHSRYSLLAVAVLYILFFPLEGCFPAVYLEYREFHYLPSCHTRPLLTWRVVLFGCDHHLNHHEEIWTTVVENDSNFILHIWAAVGCKKETCLHCAMCLVQGTVILHVLCLFTAEFASQRASFVWTSCFRTIPHNIVIIWGRPGLLWGCWGKAHIVMVS